MTTLRERVKADYLEDPEIKEVIDSILKPHLSTKEAMIALQFGVPRDQAERWNDAVEFAEKLPNHSTSHYGRFTRHRLEFRQTDSASLFEMYQRVQNSPHLEIFIDNMKLPYAATLWLPLLWFYL